MITNDLSNPKDRILKIMNQVREAMSKPLMIVKNIFPCISEALQFTTMVKSKMFRKDEYYSGESKLVATVASSSIKN